MDDELRFGKYTKEQIEDILRSALFPHEKELLNEGLRLLEFNFQDFFFPADDSILDYENKIDMLELPNYQPGVKIIETRKKLTAEQNLLIDKFFLLVFKIMHLNTQFLISIGEKEQAVLGYETLLSNNIDLKRRFNEEFPSEKLGESFRLMQDYIEELKQNSYVELSWNGSDELLNRISLKLFENGSTCSTTSFIDVFKKNRKCEIKNDHRGFFVMLIYALIDYEKPLLTSKNNSGRGGITSASKCFFEKTKNGELLISFTDVKKRIIEKSDLNTQLKLEVSDFMQEFESFLPQR